MPAVYQERYTAKDFALWSGDWELILGAPCAMSPSPTFTHQFAAGELYFQMRQQLANCPYCNPVMETDWHLAEDTVLRPDVMLVCGIQGEQVRKTPELIAEVVTETSAKRDEQIKFSLYEQEGVKVYLLIYPEIQLVKIYQLQRGRFSKIADLSHESHEVQLSDTCHLVIAAHPLWRQS